MTVWLNSWFFESMFQLFFDFLNDFLIVLSVSYYIVKSEPRYFKMGIFDWWLKMFAVGVPFCVASTTPWEFPNKANHAQHAYFVLFVVYNVYLVVRSKKHYIKLK